MRTPWGRSCLCRLIGLNFPTSRSLPTGAFLRTFDSGNTNQSYKLRIIRIMTRARRGPPVLHLLLCKQSPRGKAFVNPPLSTRCCKTTHVNRVICRLSMHASSPEAAVPPRALSGRHHRFLGAIQPGLLIGEVDLHRYATLVQLPFLDGEAAQAEFVESLLLGDLAGFSDVLGANDHHGAQADLAAFNEGAAGHEHATLLHRNEMAEVIGDVWHDLVRRSGRLANADKQRSM